MGVIGKGIGFVFKGAGTIVAGGLGVVAKTAGLAASSISHELGEGISHMGDGCFDAAHYIWTGEEKEREERDNREVYYFDRDKAEEEIERTKAKIMEKAPKK